MKSRLLQLPVLFGVIPLVCISTIQAQSAHTSLGDTMIAEYFRTETRKLSYACMADIKTIDHWNAKKETYRKQLLQMLGLDPFPQKTELNLTVTNESTHDEFTVRRLHYQSQPGLYVTANLYVPKSLPDGLPAVLYLCGHGKVKQGDISFGNKVHYHHHGSWFARNGYVCLTIDSLQLGEIEGLHHGTYSKGMWWWINRGYTPAGVEAWNCVRALDLLDSLPEVDAKRIGVTGRSGGGAYSWWIAAIDDRVKCAVPVAGITDLRNHVIDGCVDGHCDCMFMVNTYRWDYPLVAALVAPRPLLISNTDSDSIFPLDGVYRTFNAVRRIYELHDAKDKVALHITAGPHSDSQELRIHAFRWLNKHLKGDDRLISTPAVKFFEPSQLKVFDELPNNQRNTNIQETFVEAARPNLPANVEQWQTMRDTWIEALSTNSFAAWPSPHEDLDLTKVFSTSRDGVALQAYDFTSHSNIRLRLFIAGPENLAESKLIVLNAVDHDGWADFLATMRPGFEHELVEHAGPLPKPDHVTFKSMQSMFTKLKWSMAFVAPRGIGTTAWDQRRQTKIRRRFYLLGQSLDGMRVYDIRRAIQSVRAVPELDKTQFWLTGRGPMAGVALYASLFEPDIYRVELHDLPTSHRDGPFFLNVRRFLDLPQAVAMAATKSSVALYTSNEDDWAYPIEVAKRTHREKHLMIRKPVDETR